MKVIVSINYILKNNIVYTTGKYRGSINFFYRTQSESQLCSAISLQKIKKNDGDFYILAESDLKTLLANPLVDEIEFEPVCTNTSGISEIDESVVGSTVMEKLRALTSCTITTVREEQEYLNMLRKVSCSKQKPSRAGPVRSTTLETLRFSLMKLGMRSLPMLTTKSMSINSIWEELKMFLLGETTTKRLRDKNIPIWDVNTSRPHLDENGLHDYLEGTLGPVYGFQWRHFGGDWKNVEANPGIDQLRNVIDGIKVNPYSRRHVVTAWNPLDNDKMALPPCHALFEFIVNADHKLDLVFYMRSADLALGVPYNMVSYALLAHLVSIETDIEAGELIPVLGDCHVYDSHLDGIALQLGRTPQVFPCVEFIGLDDYESIDDVDNLELKILGYKPDSFIKLNMAN